MAETAVNVLIVFYSRYGRAERLATAAGVGALQGHASIRLRRLADLADEQTINADAVWKETLVRMNRDYVTPRPADPLWADVVIVAAPADFPAEVVSYLDSLLTLGSMTGKLAAPLVVGPGDDTLAALAAAAADAGFIVVPSPAEPGDAVGAARTHGRRVTEMARAQGRALVEADLSGPPGSPQVHRREDPSP